MTWRLFKARALLCIVLPVLYPWRVWQARHGYPVDLVELRREISDVWRGIE